MSWLERTLARTINWNERRIAYWQKAQSQGKRRFVFVTGVLAWGVPMLVVMTGITYTQQFGLQPPTLSGSVVFLFLLNILLWLGAGYWYGSFMWRLFERSYKERIGSHS